MAIYIVFEGKKNTLPNAIMNLSLQTRCGITHPVTSKIIRGSISRWLIKARVPNPRAEHEGFDQPSSPTVPRSRRIVPRTATLTNNITWTPGNSCMYSAGEGAVKLKELISRLPGGALHRYSANKWREQFVCSVQVCHSLVVPPQHLEQHGRSEKPILAT